MWKKVAVGKVQDCKVNFLRDLVSKYISVPLMMISVMKQAEKMSLFVKNRKFRGYSLMNNLS
jgi:hypothetical protein